MLQIMLTTVLDDEDETAEVTSLYDAGSLAAAFIRNLNLEKLVGSDVRIEVEVTNDEE